MDSDSEADGPSKEMPAAAAAVIVRCAEESIYRAVVHFTVNKVGNSK